jgi:hypothetical protein
VRGGDVIIFTNEVQMFNRWFFTALQNRLMRASARGDAYREIAELLYRNRVLVKLPSEIRQSYSLCVICEVLIPIFENYFTKKFMVRISCLVFICTVLITSCVSNPILPTEQLVSGKISAQRLNDAHIGFKVHQAP